MGRISELEKKIDELEKIIKNVPREIRGTGKINVKNIGKGIFSISENIHQKNINTTANNSINLPVASVTPSFLATVLEKTVNEDGTQSTQRVIKWVSIIGASQPVLFDPISQNSALFSTAGFSSRNR